MATTIDLPGGATAVLRDSDELTNRSVKSLRRAARTVGIVGKKLKDLGLDELRQDETDEADEEATKARNEKALEILVQLEPDEDANLDLFQRVCVVERLTEWSLDRPLPTTPDEVDDLPRPIYGVLTTEAAKLDLNEDFSVDGVENPSQGTADSEG